MKKVGSRGFSLIELLAVVVILGVLSAVGIGAYSRIVTKSKLEAYLDVVKLQAKEASKLVNAGDYYADDDNTVYYFDYKIFDDDKSMQSPFGKWINAYVAVVFDGDKYYYYWIGVDDAGWRIDYFLLSESLIPYVIETRIDNHILGSDHCPIFLEINL